MGFVSETVEVQPWDKCTSPGISRDKCWSSDVTETDFPSRLMCEDDGTVLRLYIVL